MRCHPNFNARSVCRTSSKSLHSQNQYRNDEIKHCFGPGGPPLLNETLSGQIRLRTGRTPDIPLNSDEEEEREEPAKIQFQDMNDLFGPSAAMRDAAVAKSSGSIRLDAANGMRIVLLTILLLQVECRPRVTY